MASPADSAALGDVRSPAAAVGPAPAAGVALPNAQSTRTPARLRPMGNRSLAPAAGPATAGCNGASLHCSMHLATTAEHEPHPRGTSRYTYLQKIYEAVSGVKLGKSR